MFSDDMTKQIWSLPLLGLKRSEQKNHGTVGIETLKVEACLTVNSKVTFMRSFNCVYCFMPRIRED